MASSTTTATSTHLTGASSLIDVHWSLILSCLTHCNIARVRSVCKVIHAASQLRTARPTMPLTSIFLDQLTADDTIESVESLLAQTMRGLPQSWEIDSIVIKGKAVGRETEENVKKKSPEEMKKIDQQQTLIWMVMMNICAGIIEQRNKLTATTSTSPVAASTTTTFLSTASPDLIYLVDRFSQLRILHIYDVRVHTLGYAFLLEAFSPFLTGIMLDQVRMSSFYSFVEMRENNSYCTDREEVERRGQPTILSSDPLVNPHFHEVITYITKTIWEIGNDTGSESDGKFSQSRTSRLKNLALICTSVIHGENITVPQASYLHLEVTRIIAYYSQNLYELHHSQYYANIQFSLPLMHFMYFPQLRKLTLGYPCMSGALVFGLTFPSWGYLSTLQVQHLEITDVSLDRNQWFDLLTGGSGPTSLHPNGNISACTQILEPIRKYFVEYQTVTTNVNDTLSPQEKSEILASLSPYTIPDLLSNLSTNLEILIIGLGSFLKSRDFGMLNYAEGCTTLVIKEYNVRFGHIYNLMPSQQEKGGLSCLSGLRVIRTSPSASIEGNSRNNQRTAHGIADDAEKRKIHAYLLHEWRQTRLVGHIPLPAGAVEEAVQSSHPLPHGATHSVEVNWFDPTFTPPRVYYCLQSRDEDGVIVGRYLRETKSDSGKYEICLPPGEPTEEETKAADGEPAQQQQVPLSAGAHSFVMNFLPESLRSVWLEE